MYISSLDGRSDQNVESGRPLTASNAVFLDLRNNSESPAKLAQCLFRGHRAHCPWSCFSLYRSLSGSFSRSLSPRNMPFSHFPSEIGILKLIQPWWTAVRIVMNTSKVFEQLRSHNHFVSRAHLHLAKHGEHGGPLAEFLAMYV